jgi:RimJ/RimL family protein N-acetyltransferase
MTLVSPFPRRCAPALHAWLNDPREAHFADAETSDYGAVIALLDEKNTAGQTFGAVLDGRVIGFLGFTPHTPGALINGGQYCGMVIAREHRGRGHGKRFLALVADALKEQGYEWTYAELRTDNHAIRATFAAVGAIEMRTH